MLHTDAIGTKTCGVFLCPFLEKEPDRWKLNEAEMRMAYQIESTDPNAVLNEIYMTWRLSRNQATRDTAESLMAKLRSLPNKECMDLIREVQANYRLPGKPQTIGENAGGGQAEVRGRRSWPDTISWPWNGLTRTPGT